MSPIDLTTLPPEVKAHIEGLTSQVETATGLIGELEEKLEKAKTESPNELPTLEIGKKKVAFLLPKFKIRIGVETKEFDSATLAKDVDFVAKNLDLLEKRGVVEISK